MIAAAGLALPDLSEGHAEDAARRADPRVPAREQPGRLRRPAGRRRARPQDPRRDPRRPEGRHHRRPDHRRGRDVQRAVHPRPHRGRRRPPTSRSSWSGARPPAPTTPTTSRLLDGGLPGVPHVRQLRRRAAGVRRLLAVRAALPLAVRRRAGRAARRRRRRPGRIIEHAEPGAALSEWQSKQVLAAYGIKTSKDELCDARPAAVKAAAAIGYPVVMKVSSPDLLHKSDLGLVEGRRGSAKDVRAAYDELLAQGAARPAARSVAHRRRARVRAGDAAASRPSSASPRTSCSARS